MALPANEAKKGQVLKYDGKEYLILDYQLITPGNKRGFIQFKVKDLNAGSVLTKKVMSDEQVEIASLDKRACEYLYKDGNNHVFMDQESYEQYFIPTEDLGDVMNYILFNQVCTLVFLESRAVSVDLPASVELVVEETEPAARGNTANSVTKPAKLNTGYVVKVPAFVNIGDKVKIDTRSGEFISRA